MEQQRGLAGIFGSQGLPTWPPGTTCRRALSYGLASSLPTGVDTPSSHPRARKPGGPCEAAGLRAPVLGVHQATGSDNHVLPTCNSLTAVKRRDACGPAGSASSGRGHSPPPPRDAPHPSEAELL